jgi:hypothetical protein
MLGHAAPLAQLASRTWLSHVDQQAEDECEGQGDQEDQLEEETFAESAQVDQQAEGHV